MKSGRRFSVDIEYEHVSRFQGMAFGVFALWAWLLVGAANAHGILSDPVARLGLGRTGPDYALLGSTGDTFVESLL